MEVLFYKLDSCHVSCGFSKEKVNSTSWYVPLNLLEVQVVHCQYVMVGAPGTNQNKKIDRNIIMNSDVFMG